MPDHDTLLFDQASNGGLGALNPTTGELYTGNKANQALLALETGEAGAPMFVPASAGMAPSPAPGAQAPCHRRRRHQARGRRSAPTTILYEACRSSDDF